MTQATLSASIQRQTVARQYLTAEQEWVLISQVRERTELLSRKTNGFTIEEEQIRLRGERAFNALVKECREIIWALIYRFKFSERISSDELYQVALTELSRAVKTYDPNRVGSKGKRARFISWVFFKVRCTFQSLYRDEFRRNDRQISLCQELMKTTCMTRDEAALPAIPEVDVSEQFRKQLEQLIETTLPEKGAQIFKRSYLQGESPNQIAPKFGIRPSTVRTHNHESRMKLKTDPRLQELVAEYFS
jgi:RNA polymerase sigma factor (sigma-70 family)